MHRAINLHSNQKTLDLRPAGKGDAMNRPLYGL